ncbi:MAG TPA: AbrB/MazE/SpoVT family DNA-binding domain-containing protein [Acidobacteriaceae bacterium]|nr:AbrB/MazE/SpoVT family DNA-binding domain-containing protein [Acidobacteriaceae bacterium]
MQTRVSTKGQVVLPGQLRRRLGIHAGDPLEIGVEGERIVLTLRARRVRPARIVADPVTGLPVLSAGADAPILSSKGVEEILSNFP